MKSFFPILLIAVLFSACQVNNSLPSAVATTAPASSDTLTTPTSIPINSPTLIPTPTEALKAPVIDMTRPLGTWVDSVFVPDQQALSAFTPEQQTWIIQAVSDPDHASREAKNFYNQIVEHSIAIQVGDPSLEAPLEYDPILAIQEFVADLGRSPEEKTMTPEAQRTIIELNRRVGVYAEYMFTNKIRESPVTLPYTWLMTSIGTPSNYPLKNNNGIPAQGFDPVNGQVFDLTLIGVGENRSGLTQQFLDESLSYRHTVGHNETRDTFFGEPFFVVYPSFSTFRGDLMALVPIPGTSPDVAIHGLIRTQNEQRQDKYTLIRIQFQKETIPEDDPSCMKIPVDTSQACAPGTVLNPAFMSSWYDKSGVTNIQASRAKLTELMNMSQFTNPVRIILRGDIFDQTFMDGALTVDRISIPTVPPGFFE